MAALETLSSILRTRLQKWTRLDLNDIYVLEVHSSIVQRSRSFVLNLPKREGHETRFHRTKLTDYLVRW